MYLKDHVGQPDVGDEWPASGNSRRGSRRKRREEREGGREGGVEKRVE